MKSKPVQSFIKLTYIIEYFKLITIDYRIFQTYILNVHV
jgi:hypothetical protein